MTTKALGELEQELLEAVKGLCETRRDLDAARSRETAAINRVNAAQKGIDTRISELRKEAARGTDWNRPLGFPVGAPG